MRSIAIAGFTLMMIGLVLDALLVIFAHGTPRFGWGEAVGLLLAFLGAVVASVAGMLYRRKVIKR